MRVTGFRKAAEVESRTPSPTALGAVPEMPSSVTWVSPESAPGGTVKVALPVAEVRLPPLAPMVCVTGSPRAVPTGVTVPVDGLPPPPPPPPPPQATRDTPKTAANRARILILALLPGRAWGRPTTLPCAKTMGRRPGRQQVRFHERGWATCQERTGPYVTGLWRGSLKRSLGV